MSGYFFITSNLAGNLVLDVNQNVSAPNTKVITYGIKQSGTDNQLWKKESACGDSFYLIPKNAPGLKLAIVDNQVVINECGTKLRIKSGSSLYRFVSIQSVETGYALEAGGGSVPVAAKPQVDGSDNQLFVFYNE